MFVSFSSLLENNTTDTELKCLENVPNTQRMVFNKNNSRLVLSFEKIIENPTCCMCNGVHEILMKKGEKLFIKKTSYFKAQLIATRRE